MVSDCIDWHEGGEGGRGDRLTNSSFLAATLSNFFFATIASGGGRYHTAQRVNKRTTERRKELTLTFDSLVFCNDSFSPVIE